jgi:hypothetical protein
VRTIKRCRYDDDDPIELKLCPFCCSLKVELFGDRVECERCGAQGPVLSDWEIAVRAWNEIPRPPDIRAQRVRWNERARTEQKRKMLAKREREKRDAERDAPKRKREREDREWARAREAWLRSPVGSDV